eukprot:169830_1
MNMTVYRYNEYKLFLGQMLLDQLFIEPDDNFLLNSIDRTYENYDWIITVEYISYFIATVLGPDWMWFEGNIMIFGRILFLNFNRNENCPKISINMISLDKKPPNNQTFHWPFIDEKEFGNKCQNVRLYNLETDPTESNNLAYNDEYKEIVIDLLNKLQKKLKNEYKLNQIGYDRSYDGLIKLAVETQTKLRRIFLIAILIIGSLLFICCCGLYRCCGKKQSKGKSKKD